MKRLLVLILLMASAAGAEPSTNEQAGNPVWINVNSPSFGFCRQGRPVTAAVTMTNSLTQLTGAVEAWVGERRTASISVQSFSIGNGIFRFFLYPLTTEGTPERLTVRVVDKDGRELASDWIQLNVPESRYWIATAGQGDGRFARDIMSSIGAAVLPVRRTDFLPDNWFGYTMFDAVIWDGQRSSDLNESQRAALSGWIMTGGHLILAAGSGDSKLHSPIPDTVPDIQGLPSDFLAGGSSGDRLLSDLGFISRTDGLFSEKPLGLGSIMVFRREAAALSGLTAEQALPMIGLPSNFSSMAAGDPGHEYEHSHETAIGTLQAELASAAGYQSVSFLPILVMMILYIAFVAVADPLVLRKLRMLPRTWLTFPASICIFSAVSFMVFYRGRLGSDMRQELCFQDVAPDGSGRTSIISCIRKPSRKNFTFEAPASHAFKPLSSESLDYSGYYYGSDDPSDPSRLTMIIDAMRQDGSKVIAIPGHMGSFKFFTEEWPTDNSALPFQCSFTSDANGIKGSFTKSGLVPDSFSGFVFFRDAYHALDTSSMAITQDRHPLYEDTGRFDYYYHGRRRPSSEGGMKKGLEDWTSESLGSMVMSSFMYYRGSIPDTWHNDDVIFRHSRQGDQAILYAFFEEDSSTATPPFRRVRCIRQVVKVNNEGS